MGAPVISRKEDAQPYLPARFYIASYRNLAVTCTGDSSGFTTGRKTVVQPGKKRTSHGSIQGGICGADSDIANLGATLIAGVDRCHHPQELPSVPSLENIGNSGDEDSAAPE